MARWAPIPLRLIVGYGFMEHGFAKLAKGPDFSAAEADVIYLSCATRAAADRAAAFLDSDPWRTLSANRDNRVYVVNDEIWQTGEGVIAARGIVDDLRLVNAAIN